MIILSGAIRPVSLMERVNEANIINTRGKKNSLPYMTGNIKSKSENNLPEGASKRLLLESSLFQTSTELADGLGLESSLNHRCRWIHAPS